MLHAGAVGGEVVVEPATVADLPDVLALLAGHSLPLEGAAEHLDTMLVARKDATVVGVAALERYPDGDLLRSLAVAVAVQGSGVGRMLTTAALHMAAAAGVQDVFLLTTTAERYFPKFGFERIARGDVPVSVQASVEFGSACPASAVVMRKRLGAGA